MAKTPLSSKIAAILRPFVNRHALAGTVALERGRGRDIFYYCKTD